MIKNERHLTILDPLQCSQVEEEIELPEGAKNYDKLVIQRIKGIASMTYDHYKVARWLVRCVGAIDKGISDEMKTGGNARMAVDKFLEDPYPLEMEEMQDSQFGVAP